MRGDITIDGINEAYNNLRAHCADKDPNGRYYYYDYLTNASDHPHLLTLLT